MFAWITLLSLLLLNPASAAPTSRVHRSLTYSHCKNASIETYLGPQLSQGAAIYLPGDGEIFVSSKERYSELNNPGIVAVVDTATNDDVERTAKYAICAGKKFLVYNTGHGWTNMTATQDAILIKVSRLDAISIDTRRNTVTFGSGQTVGTLVPALHAAKKQMPTGTCNCVGLLGAALGGGHGRLQGMYGLIADNLISAKVLLASGELVTVSARENNDLYYALKGAGHNFGIVLSAEFKIYDQLNNGNYYDGVMTFGGDQIENVFRATNSFTLDAKASIYLTYIYNATISDYNLILGFAYAGPFDEGKALFDSAYGHLSGVALSRSDDIRPWDQLNSRGLRGLVAPFCTVGGRKDPYSVSVKEYDVPAMRELWDTFVSLHSTYPDFASTVVLLETYPLQGVRAVDFESTAYPNRDVRHIILPFLWYYDAANDGIAKEWGNKMRNILQRNDGFGDQHRVYMNYARGDEPLGAKYGYDRARLQKLAALKKKYDPSGRFNAYNPIPTSV